MRNNRIRISTYITEKIFKKTHWSPEFTGEIIYRSGYYLHYSDFRSFTYLA
jgi:hypothetical protein